MPNTVLKRIIENAALFPDRKAYITEVKADNKYERLELSYGELGNYSNEIANYLNTHLSSKTPVIIVGHKHPYSVAAFLGCSRSGRAYVPVDSSFPVARIKDIIDAVKPELVFVTDDDVDLDCDAEIRKIRDIEEIIKNRTSINSESDWVSGEDDYYIIFTSGSTGKPKGVKLTSTCLENFTKWALTLKEDGSLDDGEHRHYVNQAPFSFDLSVFDIYTTLYTGGTLLAISKEVQFDSTELYRFIGSYDPKVWFSTPSFAEIALAGEDFNENLMPNIDLFLLCGETLTNKTADKLISAFPHANIFNTFGPTESTVAVTSIKITPEISRRYSPLPIGTPKPGTYIYIMDEDNNILPDEEKGEIVIVGDTVSSGYWKNEEKSKEAFGVMNVDGIDYRLYHTRDKGYYKDGLLFYSGRLDLQIKLHGYRIEIEDIESNILNVSGIEKAVIMPNYSEGEISSLTAYIVPKNEISSNLKERRRIREELKKFIPEYMIPRNFVFKKSLPITTNGKVDRKKLEAAR